MLQIFKVLQELQVLEVFQIFQVFQIFGYYRYCVRDGYKSNELCTYHVLHMLCITGITKKTMNPQILTS